MKESKTISMLQRLSLILAVTAASYGLPLQAHASRALAAGFGKAMGKTAQSAASEQHTQAMPRTS